MSIEPARNYIKEDREEEPPNFFIDLFRYLQKRTHQVWFFFYSLLVFLSDSFGDIKVWVIRRMFWGRSSLYRSGFHVLVSTITVGAVLTGLSSRLNILASETQGLDISSGVLGRQDILSQSGTAESIFAISENEPDYPVYKHKVQKNETLSQIAEIYQINANTIKWANDLESDTVITGQILRIPGIDGAFVKVEEGDTLESIAIETNGTVADIIDLNSNILNPRNPVLQPGMELFIPGGEVILPTPTPVPQYSYYYTPPTVPPPTNNIVVPAGTFIHPLSNCPGWSWSRGYSAWHRGVDMAKSGGCWVNAAAAGTVIRAQLSYGGEGFNVVIDHGNGLWTRYYHGSGVFNVSVGQYVNAGDNIMYMGNTGYSFGTHLHFEVVINENRVDPEAYVNLR